jgi:hypothetical protein
VVEHWEHLYGRWEPLDLPGVASFMQGFERPWWVVGGRCVDAFTGTPREHEDVDVSILACDVPALRSHVGDRWHLWNLCNGDMRPLDDRHPEIFEPASQLWVRANGNAPWLFDLPLTPDQDGLWTNKFLASHRAPVEDVTWVADDHIRYLNPEVVLFYKSRHRRTKDERDFAVCLPLLSAEQRTWLYDAITMINPANPWLADLEGTTDVRS